MTILTRQFLALFLPGLIEIVAHLIVGYVGPIKGIFDFISNETRIVLFVVASASTCIFFLRGVWLNRFWKIYLFSVLSASWPWMIYLVIMAVINGTGGYYPTAVIYISLLLIAGAIVELPINYVVYKLWHN